MLDRRFVLENPDIIRANIRKRHIQLDLEAFLRAEQERLTLLREEQELREEGNRLAGDKSAATETKRTRGRALRQRRDAVREKLAALEQQAGEILRSLPNLAHADVPEGADDKASREIGKSAIAPPVFDFPAADHVALMEKLDMADFAAGGRIAGAGFYYLKGAGARLEHALHSFALAKLEEAGFTLIMPPELVREAVLTGTGYAPRGDEANSYRLEGEDLHLIATSEIPLCGLYADTILSADSLPLRLGGLSRCFRAESGAAGQAGKGLYRVHQFTKAEMVVICRPEESETLHEEIVQREREIFDALELPYRIVDVAAGDLGASAARKYDLEVWMAGRQGGVYAEATSASNCTDYQARRLGIRWRAAEGGKPVLAHTLNGTALAAGRAMIALIENNQQADGSIRLPAMLHPYFGDDMIRAK